MKARLHEHDFYFKSEPLDVGREVTFLVRAVVQGVEAEILDVSYFGGPTEHALGQTTTSFMPTSIERLV